MATALTWKVIGASVQGSSHLRLGVGCQDAHGYWTDGTGTLAVVIADGAGSAKRSDLGANAVVAETLDFVRRRSDKWVPLSNEEYWRSFFHELIEALVVRIEATANENAVQLAELATTVSVAIARPEGAAAAQLGDGAVILRNSVGELITLARPMKGEYANETVFLVSPGARDLLQIAFYAGDISDLAALTDGLQLLALRMPSCDPSDKFFPPLLRFLQRVSTEAEGRTQLEVLLKSQKITSRADDDLTVILAHLACQDEATAPGPH